MWAGRGGPPTRAPPARAPVRPPPPRPRWRRGRGRRACEAGGGSPRLPKRRIAILGTAHGKTQGKTQKRKTIASVSKHNAPSGRHVAHRLPVQEQPRVRVPAQDGGGARTGEGPVEGGGDGGALGGTGHDGHRARDAHQPRDGEGEGRARDGPQARERSVMDLRAAATVR